MNQDQFYRTTIQILRQLRIPFVDPCDTNYTGDCICGSTGPLLNGLFSIENNDLPIGLSSFRVPNQLSIIGGTSNSQLVFEEFVDWGVFAENFELEGSNNVTINSGATMDLASSTYLYLDSPLLRLNGAYMPTGQPVDESLPPGTYLRVVDQDGELAGTNGWLGISDLGGAGGIFDAANEGGTIAVENIYQASDLYWELERHNLQMNGASEVKISFDADNFFKYSAVNTEFAYPGFTLQGVTEGFGQVYFTANVEEGINISTANVVASSEIYMGGNAGPISIQTPDDQTIKVGSNTYFERGETYAKMAAGETQYIVISNSDESIFLQNNNSLIEIGNGIQLQGPTSSFTLNDINLEIADNTTNKKGIELIGFGENPTTGIGGDYSTLAPNSLVPKAYVDAQRPYKIYTAFLTQSGTNAPVATVLENSIEADITFTRGDSGEYYILADAPVFIEYKTMAFIVNELNTTNMRVYFEATDQLTILSSGDNNAGTLEIRVYN